MLKRLLAKHINLIEFKRARCLVSKIPQETSSQINLGFLHHWRQKPEVTNNAHHLNHYFQEQIQRTINSRPKMTGTKNIHLEIITQRNYTH